MGKEVICQSGDASVYTDGEIYWLQWPWVYGDAVFGAVLGGIGSTIRWALDTNRYYEESEDTTAVSKLLLDHFTETQVALAVLEGL